MQIDGANSRELVYIARLLEADDGLDAVIFAHLITYLEHWHAIRVAVYAQ